MDEEEKNSVKEKRSFSNEKSFHIDEFCHWTMEYEWAPLFQGHCSSSTQVTFKTWKNHFTNFHCPQLSFTQFNSRNFLPHCWTMRIGLETESFPLLDLGRSQTFIEQIFIVNEPIHWHFLISLTNSTDYIHFTGNHSTGKWIFKCRRDVGYQLNFISKNFSADKNSTIKSFNKFNIANEFSSLSLFLFEMVFWKMFIWYFL